MLEWVAHHRAIGFDHIVVAWNDCTDGTDLILKRLETLGIITQFENTPPYAVDIQREAFEKARRLNPVAKSEWLILLDADEFLNIHVSDGSVQDLLRRHTEDVDAIIINWRVFGDGGETHWRNAPVCDTFERACANPDWRCQVKTFFKNNVRFQHLTQHAPWSAPAVGAGFKLNIRSQSGTRLRGDIFQLPLPIVNIRSSRRNWEVAQINHYLTKTRDVFSLKAARGRGADTSKTRHTDQFFDKMNCNDVEDTSISRTAKARANVLAELMADPVLARLHMDACAHLQSRIAANHEA